MTPPEELAQRVSSWPKPEERPVVEPPGEITFLGTAGTRFVMVTQRRASGGMWIRLPEGDFSIDPGPGALIQACRLGLMKDRRLEGVLLTHRHLDHSSDLNALTEAMVTGNRKPCGLVALPVDAVTGPEPILFSYLRSKLARIHLWADGPLEIGSITVSTVLLRHHGVECRGLRFSSPYFADWGILSDTCYFPELAEFYRGCHTLIADVTLMEKVRWIQHLSVPDLPELMALSHVSRLVMTHMGNGILDAGPENLAQALSTPQCLVCAACDGMTLRLPEPTNLPIEK